MIIVTSFITIILYKYTSFNIFHERHDETSNQPMQNLEANDIFIYVMNIRYFEIYYESILISSLEITHVISL
jgi:hypothetical protein